MIVVWSIFTLFSNWTTSIMQDKPTRAFHSTNSILESKKSKVWVETYTPTKQKYFSFDKLDSFSISETWMELNRNNHVGHPKHYNFDYILVVSFNTVTKNDLHKFKLIPYYDLEKDEIHEETNPDGYPRIRFLLNVVPDTIKIEVIERNPKDSIYFMTEKVLDTITFIKTKQP